MSGDKKGGLTKKYDVTRVDRKPINWCFVLEDKDPLAIPALDAYSKAAKEAGFEFLAADLYDKAREMERHGGRMRTP